MVRNESEIRAKIQEGLRDLQDFAAKPNVEPEDFFKVARQATFMTALYWTLGEDVPKEVTGLAVPLIKKLGEAQAEAATKTKK